MYVCTGRDGHLALTDFGLCKSFEDTQVALYNIYAYNIYAYMYIYI